MRDTTDPDVAPPQLSPATATQLARIAHVVQQYHLETPALMLLTIARPLGFVGSQCLTFVQPLAPYQEWQERIGQTAAQLEDAAVWTHLENLLHCPAD